MDRWIVRMTKRLESGRMRDAELSTYACFYYLLDSLIYEFPVHLLDLIIEMFNV